MILKHKGFPQLCYKAKNMPLWDTGITKENVTTLPEKVFAEATSGVQLRTDENSAKNLISNLV